jgi:hypothetical protein
MLKFEISIIHRQDDGIVKSVNKVESNSLLELLSQLFIALDEMVCEIEEKDLPKKIKEHEDNDGFPF